MKKYVALVFTAFLTGSSYAHHEIQPYVDLGALTHFSGVITGLEWAEPHVLIRLVGNPYLQNSPQWLVEVDPPTDLMSRGFSMSDFELLTRISIIGYQAKHVVSYGETYIYGLYLRESSGFRALLNERLLRILPYVDEVGRIITDDGIPVESFGSDQSN